MHADRYPIDKGMLRKFAPWLRTEENIGMWLAQPEDALPTLGILAVQDGNLMWCRIYDFDWIPVGGGVPRPGDLRPGPLLPCKQDGVPIDQDGNLLGRAADRVSTLQTRCTELGADLELARDCNRRALAARSEHDHREVLARAVRAAWVDFWGCIKDGVRAWGAALDLDRTYRARIEELKSELATARATLRGIEKK
jgi:hypothetical protein